jgi:transcriptional regulator with XRE-family HTH domain
MNPEQVIGNNIKKKREEKAIKLETLGKQLNISKGRMSQIESDDCKELTISRIIKIAQILEVDFFEIAGNQTQSVTISNSQNSSGFYGTHNNITPELITTLAEEIAKRITK